MSGSRRTPVLVVAGGADWEPEAMRTWEHPGSGVALVRRCMDLPDLLAVATTGLARVAVIDGAVFGLDGDALGMLRRWGLLTVVVEDLDRERMERLGADLVIASTEVTGAVAALAVPRTEQSSEPEPVTAPGSGSVVAVWGPAGAPGRSTVAASLAAGLAPSVLVDADPYGGAQGQLAGLVEPVSGVLAAARLAGSGGLDPHSLGRVTRQVGGVRVLTGLPRSDRWDEVRAMDAVLETARGVEPWVVVDTGFSLERDRDALAGAPDRNAMTAQSLSAADVVVAVGTPDALGLARLVRGLSELGELLPDVVPLVVVNRMRRSVGWSSHDVEDTLRRAASYAGVVFVPDDPDGADRALLAGEPLLRTGGGATRKALAAVVESAQELSMRYSPATV